MYPYTNTKYISDSSPIFTTLWKCFRDGTRNLICQAEVGWKSSLPKHTVKISLLMAGDKIDPITFTCVEHVGSIERYSSSKCDCHRRGKTGTCGCGRRQVVADLSSVSSRGHPLQRSSFVACQTGWTREKARGKTRGMWQIIQEIYNVKITQLLR